MNKPQKLLEDSSAFTEENAGFLEALYEQFLKDPLSVDPSWRERFGRLQSGSGESEAATKVAVPAPSASDEVVLLLRKQTAVDRLIALYRSRGHQAAENNPLKLNPPPWLPDLAPSSHGLVQEDLDREFYVDVLRSTEKQTLRQILARLHRTYCGSVGAEYSHIVDTDIKEWIQNRLETAGARAEWNRDQKLWTLRMLTAAEGIEKYLHRKYVGQKRFSLEGGESLIPLLDEVIQWSGQHGIRETVLGMAHRGRLNVLVNILGKKPSLLFQEFEETAQTEPIPGGSGDVKYHLGFSSDVETPGGPMHLAMAFNPSHLEAVNPVVEGSVRARQDRLGDDGENAVMAILVHGDAAFAGQGVVMETLNMAETRAYTTGGTIHVVVNNQIGFTTSNPFDARSTLNCTDVAYMVQAPVFHVNGDDPEAVLYVTRLAVDYRMKFKRDVVIDLICLRRHGHNEVDEPAVTQPLMYQFIRKHPGVRKIYGDALVAEGILSGQQVQDLDDDYQARLERGESVGRPMIAAGNYSKTRWDHFIGADWATSYDSRVAPDRLREIAEAWLRVPEGFELHPRAAAIVEARRKMSQGQLPADWGYGENMAYATLLAEGCNIRLTGQDVGRGTFFHRHAILYDQHTGSALIPLQNLGSDQGRIHIYDSLLSEEGVVGFEYGYSSTEPETLTIWEAQFGDFANNAQVMIDQFITSGETKWGRLSGLVMLLPHGYEGQGPEHSSGRLERYLQMCADMNIQVCVPTTPAQIFHLLRRQLLRRFRKPLIVFTPKSLLRHKLAVSTLEQLSDGRFQPLLGEVDPLDPERVTRAVICAGKVYYDLLETRRKEKLVNVAIIRVEQLYPFPQESFCRELAAYPKLKEMVWCQEEPANQGAWYQIKHRFFGLLSSEIELGYAGRPFSAAPAVGKFSRHLEQQRALVADALYAPPSINR
ncbi:MAG: 2-oxoglutarate dehydrogenase E1 component [Methylococcaceae bacterium]|nr:2-oxoglutarate dehydrogenase E1 component [Methylococcaceae bacterium]